MSDDMNTLSIWKGLSYALGAFSQALILFLLYLIFQQQGNIYDRMTRVEIGQARLEGVVSVINANNPAAPINKSKNERTDQP
jgi:hypothetical protein